MISDKYIKNRNFNLSSVSKLGFEYEGYTFKGWKTDLCGDILLSDMNNVVFNSNDVYISAQWMKEIAKNLIMKSITGVEYKFDTSSPDINRKLQYCSSDSPNNPITPYSIVEELQDKNNLGEVDDAKGEISSIGNDAFIYCSNLSSIECQGVTNIGYYAFYYCSKLPSINIPNVTSIGIGAFTYCSNLSSINIPNVSSIDRNAFAWCSNLSTIDFSERTLTTIPTLDNTNAFSDIPSNYQIKVPSSLYDNWIKAINWSTIASHIVAV